MLIKSQNGIQIVNLDNCISISFDGNNHIIAFYPFVDGYDKLGKYSYREGTKSSKLDLGMLQNVSIIEAVFIWKSERTVR